jgi:hypothetical protein
VEADHADAFRIMLQQHSLKEEGILYPRPTACCAASTAS